MFSDRVSNLITFYDLLARLVERQGERRTLAAVNPDQVWPAHGIYFFFEPGEVRTLSGQGDRVVRVATHSYVDGGASAFWGGLLGTRGGPSGKGNHRASIFRQLVGEALLRRSGRALPSWGVGSSQRATAQKMGLDLAAVAAAEGALEIEVSDYIRQMPFIWLTAPRGPSPDGRRAYFERQTIGLLSNATGQADPPSPAWLGRLSSRERVRASGLWNSNHVQRGYSDRFLTAMAAAVDVEPVASTRDAR